MNDWQKRDDPESLRARVERANRPIDPKATWPFPASSRAMGPYRASDIEWAVGRWRAEVEHRPLVNVHRRALDDTWRQVIRYFGGDPDQLVGPSHDVLVAQEKLE